MKKLADDELESVNGGKDVKDGDFTLRKFCPYCNDYREVGMGSGDRYPCQTCHNTFSDAESRAAEEKKSGSGSSGSLVSGSLKLERC